LLLALASYFISDCLWSAFFTSKRHKPSHHVKVAVHGEGSSSSSSSSSSSIIVVTVEVVVTTIGIVVKWTATTTTTTIEQSPCLSTAS
jgi:hypothetical protein